MSGLVMLAVLSYDGTRRRAGWFLVAVALAALTKFTAFEAVGAAVLYLVALPCFHAVAREESQAAETGTTTAASGLPAHRGGRLGDVRGGVVPVGTAPEPDSDGGA